MSNARNLSNLLGTGATIASGSIADDAITSAKIADDAVVSAAIADDAITSALIADNAVGSAALDLTANYAFTGTVTGAGKILQYVHQDADTSGTLVTSSTNSFSNAFTTTITPTDATSIILCICSFSTRDTRDGDQLISQYRMVRQISGGSDVVLSSAKTGYSDSENVEVHLRYISHPAAARIVTGKTFTVQDDHNTTSQITYKLQMRASNEVGAGGCYFTLLEIAT